MSQLTRKFPTHLAAGIAPVNIRRGSFWIPGDVVPGPRGPVQVGPMHVEWEALADATKPPVVLIHGGGGQATDWKTTPDGRHGWADRLVRAGHPVYLVDRPGHGRSPAHPEVVGALGSPGGYGSTSFVFVPGDPSGHTEWPWGREPGDPELDQLVASAGFLPQDIALGQRRDADRLARLLGDIGPAILIAHSAGAPAAWLVGMEHPELASAVVAIEPMGPPYGEIPGVGALTFGLTATEPAAGVDTGLVALARVPIAVVTGEISPFVPAGYAVADYLTEHGVDAASIHLPAAGITGNGHGMFFERNSDEVLQLVLDWVDRTVGDA